MITDRLKRWSEKPWSRGVEALPEKLRETAGTIREDIECLDGVLEDFRDGKLKIEE